MILDNLVNESSLLVNTGGSVRVKWAFAVDLL